MSNAYLQKTFSILDTPFIVRHSPTVEKVTLVMIDNMVIVSIETKSGLIKELAGYLLDCPLVVCNEESSRMFFEKVNYLINTLQNELLEE